MVDRHGEPHSTELVRDDMADYEDQVPVVPVPEVVARHPNTQSARFVGTRICIPMLEGKFIYW